MTKRTLYRMILFCLLTAGVPLCGGRNLLIEAEKFDTIGGWSNDQQYMDQMGSPFLIAHGLGHPVDDAVTKVTLPSPGTYRVWVRTRDWAAPWKKPNTQETKRAHGTPGLFNVVIDGVPLETRFGTKGDAWHWHDGGSVELKNKVIELRLRDLTGFAGRCDAILLSSDLEYTPPDEAPAAWRRKLLGIPEQPEDGGEFDLVVVGGGSAGMTAAVSAGKYGLRVALIHNRPVPGGNASTEARIGYTGRGMIDPYPNLGRVTDITHWSYKQRVAGQPFHGTALTDHIAEIDRRRLELLESAGVKLFFNRHVNAARTGPDGRITEVIAQNIVDSRLISVRGRWFADCTGDGNLGFLVDADYDMAFIRMGLTNLSHWRDTKQPTPFPRVPWALDLSEKPFPGREGAWECPDRRFRNVSGWYWESGFSHDPFERGEYIRDWNFRAVYGAWDVLKNIDDNATYRNREIGWMGYISGARESRRLLGDLILTAQDLKLSRAYPDGIVPTSWRMDIHLPNPYFQHGFKGDEFISWAPRQNSHYPMPYLIPYRCLYSRNIPNLFMAGRNISVTSHALGAVRVQWTTGMMGEVLGMAAYLCGKYDTDPRGLFPNHIEELKGLAEAGVPGIEPVAAGRPVLPATGNGAFGDYIE